jgi:hypothetical protein
MAFNTSISSLSGTSTFYDWYIKENSEIIAKLNQCTVSGVSSGDGVLAGLCASSGIVTVSIGGTSGNIRSGLTFSGSISFLGETAVPNISYKITGITSGTNGYTFGSVIRITSTGYTTAIASDADSAEVIGVLSSRNPSYSIVTLSGQITGDFTDSAGGTLSPGCVYFLDPSNKGKITTTEPSTVGQVSKPVIIGLGQTAAAVVQYRGNYLNSSTSGGGESGTNRLYIAFTTTNDPRTQGFSAGVFLSYAPELVSGSTFFNKYLQDTGRTAINGWFISGSKNQAYRLYDYGSEYLNLPWEEDYIIGMIETINATTPPNLIYQIIARGTTSIIPKSISSSPLTQTGIWCVSGATFSVSGTTGQLVKSPITTSNDPYAPVYQAGVVFSTSPTSWYVNPRPLSKAPTTNFRSSQLPENLTNGLNYAFNGDFSVWQRDTGKSSAYTSSGNVYFADHWVRRMAGITGVQSIQRQSFSVGQTDVEDTPDYYVDIKAITTSGASGGTTPINSTYSIGHIVDGANAFTQVPITVSLYAKCTSASYTANVYFAIYLAGSSTPSSKTIIGTISLGTAWTKHTLNYTPSKQTTADSQSYVEIGIDLNPLVYKGYNAGIVTGTNLVVSVASLAIYDGTFTAPPHNYLKYNEKLQQAQKYYYSTYTDSQTTASTTMLDDYSPALNAFSFTYLPNASYGLHRLPVRMRTTPTISVYSPKSGVATEMYNYTAFDDLRKCNGSYGYGGAQRNAPLPLGTSTISSSSDATTVRINLNGGAVPYDVVVGHVIADASYPI